jgi:hypothetical protein
VSESYDQKDLDNFSKKLFAWGKTLPKSEQELLKILLTRAPDSGQLRMADLDNVSGGWMAWAASQAGHPILQKVR